MGMLSYICEQKLKVKLYYIILYYIILRDKKCFIK